MRNKKETNNEPDFSALQKELDEITSWFENSDNIDPTEGLRKYRRSVEIVKIMRSHLQDVENQFEQINKELEE